MYTLKLDWTHERAAFVVRALDRAGLALATESRCYDLYSLAAYGQPGDEATLKLDWTAQEINAVRDVLGAELVRIEQALPGARDNQPGPSYAVLAAEQALIWAARHDIEIYLLGSESLSGVSRRALAERPL